jgi:hypothetical protein
MKVEIDEKIDEYRINKTEGRYFKQQVTASWLKFMAKSKLETTEIEVKL